jgi:transcriptional regulator GlxA family with amidase domain
VSDRQLTRIFKTELGMTPAAYIESARVEAARNRLESTDDTLERVASACGFNTIDTLIRAFRRRLDTTPTEYRSRFRHCGH